MDLRTYRSIQDEYKEKKWYKEPTVKFRHRSEVRLAKRRAQHSISRERDHVDVRFCSDNFCFWSSISDTYDIMVFLGT